jgi:DsbC/DsbD-like thiol-disulfide interchange protein
MLVALLAGAGLALAPEAILTVRPPEELTLRPGGRASAVLEMSVREGFHVQANPAANEFLIPLTVTFKPAEAVKAGEPRYPPPQRYRLEGTEEDLLVYGGVFTVSVPVEVPRSSAPGRYTLQGKVRYQACDERSCRPPALATVEVGVRIRKAE